MSAKFEAVKKYYDLGFWSEAKVRRAVEKGWITAAEFQTITGKKYQLTFQKYGIISPVVQNAQSNNTTLSLIIYTFL